MKKNNKGFTLIELLAVIVILAVLILVALPAVTNLMTRARKSAFRSEALSMAREGVQLAYSANMISGTSTPVTANITDTSKTHNIVYKISGGEYLCMTFSDLLNKGYIEKSNTTGYAGYIQIFVDTAGKSYMYVTLTNGTYYIVSEFNALANSNDVDSKVTTTAGSYKSACPTIKTTSTWNGTDKLMGQ